MNEPAKLLKNRDIILARREKVKELYYVKGKIIQEIADELDWNPHTIFRDIEALREATKRIFTGENLKDIFIKLYEQNEWQLKELVREYQTPDLKPGMKLMLRREMQQVWRNTKELMQEFGIVDKTPDELKVTVDKFEENRKWIQEYYLKKKNKKQDPSLVQSS